MMKNFCQNIKLVGICILKGICTWKVMETISVSCKETLDIVHLFNFYQIDIIVTFLYNRNFYPCIWVRIC